MTETERPEEPFFITEEIEAEMIKAGYVFEPPKRICLRPSNEATLTSDESSPSPISMTETDA